MNRREAKRIAEEDTTPYAVASRGRTGIGVIHVTGYLNAKIVRRDGDIILTGSEIKKLHSDPAFRKRVFGR